MIAPPAYVTDFDFSAIVFRPEAEGTKLSKRRLLPNVGEFLCQVHEVRGVHELFARCPFIYRILVQRTKKGQICVYSCILSLNNVVDKER